jgi:hypothetical protein
VLGISNPASSGTGPINETLVNTTSNPINVTYVYTLSANGCTNPITYNVVVIVTPTLTLSSTLTPPAICSNTLFSYTPTSNTAGTIFTWTRAAVLGISNPASSGTGPINETLVNTTPNPINVTYVYTLTANGCSNNQNVVVAVKPIPTLTSLLNPPAICSNTLFSYIPTSGTPGTIFLWNRAAIPGISNPAASGSGNPNETLINTTPSPINVTYVYTLMANGCSNIQNVVVTVNPKPTLTSSLTPPAICSNTLFSYTPTSGTAGTTFAWTRAAVAGISNPAASGTGNPNEILINITTAPINVTYVYTLTANGCANPALYNVVVVVNPIPTLTSSLTPPGICSNTLFSYNPTSGTAGTTFAWNRPAVAGISNPTASGTGNPNEILVNTTAAPINVTYVYTLSANGCINSTSYNVVVSVNPTPTLTSTLTPTSICSNTLFSYTPTSGVTGTIFAWTRAVIAGISNPAASGTGDPNETLINVTVDPIPVTYVYTLSANGCTNPTTYNVIVTVNPTPMLTSTLTPPAICSNTTFSYTPTSGTAGTIFSWTRAAVAGISNPPASGTVDPNEILVNTTNSSIIVTYVYTLTAYGCTNPVTYNITVTVNPTPSLTSSLTPPDICSNTIFSYTPTSGTAGTVFNWNRAVVPGISNPASSGTGDPGEVLFNTTPSPVSVTYIYILTVNGCSSASYNVVVVVKPIPTLTSTLTPPAICSNTLFSYTPTSGTTGTTFTWSRAAVAGISNPAASGTGDPNETLVNTTADPILVTYVYTLSANGCTNPTTYNVVVTVNPIPVLTSSLTPPAICSNTIFSYTPTSSTFGITFSWTRADVTGISNPAASGTGNPNEILINTTTIPVSVTYVYVLSGNGCTSAPYNVVVAVNPTPTLTSTLTPPAICSNTVFSYTPASGTAGTTFAWSRALVLGISNPPASGTGNPNETLINITTAPLNVTYVYTLTDNGCTNPVTYIVVVTVNPTPMLTNTLTPPAICSNTLFSYNPTSGTAGTTFAWSRADVAGISNPTASGTRNPNETLINTTALPVNVTYVYTLTANGCSNIQNVIVTVNPTPTLTSTLTPPAICSNTVFSYTPTSGTPGTTFAWTRAAVAGISNPAASGTGNPNETLINTTTAPVNVVYIYTLSANGCSNIQNVVVIVNPTPTLTSTLTPPAICSNTLFSYNPTSGTAGITFAWSRAAMAGISNPAASGTGNPNETLINTTALPVNVTYVYTLTANGCSNIQNVIVTVNPTPTLTSTLTPPAICSNTIFSYAPTSETPGTTFAWTRSAVAGISNPAGSGIGNPNETLINTTVIPVNVTYVYTLSANGCTNPSTYNVVVTVNSIPLLTSTLIPPAICSGTVFSYTPTSTMAGTVFAWTRATVAGISNPAGSGTGNPNETLINTTTAPVNVTYIYTLTANGCTNPVTYSVVVTVNPKPTLSSTLTPPGICSGSVFSYNPTSNTVGTTFNWSRDAVPGISQPANSGTGNPNEQLDNTTASAIAVTYVYTLTANGCTNTQNVVLMVTPVPVMTSNLFPPSFCSNTLFSYTPTSTITGTTFAWTRAAVAGISNPAASGSGNINETLINTSTNPIAVVYVYTLVANGCTNPVTYDVAVVVLDIPVVTATASSNTICAGASIDLFSNVTNLTLPSILLSENFNAATNNWTTINNSTGGTPANAAWTLRPNGYVQPNDAGYTFHSNDNTQFYLSDSRYQNGITTVTYLQSPVMNTVGYTALSLNFWHYFRYQGTTNEAARVQVSTNGTTWTTVATYTSTQGGAAAFVNPIINLNAYVGNATFYVRFYYYCGGRGRYWAIDNVNVTGTSPAPVVSWTSVPVGYTSNQQNPVGVTPLVTTTFTATYTDPLNPCPGSASTTVTVNPIPTVIAAPATQTVCSDSPIGTITLTNPNNVPGTTFSWTRNNTVNLTGMPASGSGSTITGTLTNVTLVSQTTIFTITATANGCTSASTTASVIIKPVATVNAVTNATYCNGAAATAITFGSNIAGSTYAWTSTIDVGFGTSGIGNIPVYTASNGIATPIIATVSVTAIVNGCTGPVRTFTVTVNPTPVPTITANYCAVPGFIQLTASPTTGVTYLWSTEQTINPILVNIAAQYSVIVTSTYGCSATAILPVSTELVVNGNFSAGNVGFTSVYSYVAPAPNALWPEGLYTVDWNPNYDHTNFWGRDHTDGVLNPVPTNAGNLMIVNGAGATPQIAVWQEVLTVLPNMPYYFSAWAMSMNSVEPYAQLRFSVNGTLVGTTAVLPSRPQNNNPPYNWIQFYGNWTSPAGVTSATLQIVDLQTAPGGNDFGLDDISFGTLAPIPIVITPSVNAGNPVCEGDTLHLTSNVTGGLPPIIYSWIGPNGFTSNLPNPNIPNVTMLNAGTYTLTVTDGYGCGPVSASATAIIYPAPNATISGTTSVCLNAASPLITFTGSNGLAPYTFTYTINGGPNQNISTTSGNSVTLPVPTGTAGSFVYALVSVSDANSCTHAQSSTATVTVYSLPTCSITGANQVCPLAAGKVYTAAAGMSTYAWTISGNGSIVGPANGSTVSITAGPNCNDTFILSVSINDSHLCSSSCSKTVVVQDLTIPAWTTTAGSLNTTLQCSDLAGLAAAQALFPAATDNCTTILVPVKTAGPFVAGSCPQAGTYTNTWMVSDACGNAVAAPFTQVITIIDNLAPVWTTAPGALNVTLECSDAAGIAVAQAMVPVASDNCDASLTPVKTAGPFVPGSCPFSGTYTNTWMVSDHCGNTVSAPYIQVITIHDNTAPVITCPVNIIVNCQDSKLPAFTGSATAIDNCDPAPVITYTDVTTAGSCPGNYIITRTWKATDHCSNFSACVQTITVHDITPPILTCPPDATVNCQDPHLPANTGTATATDNCDPAPVVTYTDITTAGTCAGNYVISRTWHATDNCGNVSSCMQTITVHDITPPVITCPINITINCNVSPLPANTGTATATDNCDPSPVITYTDANTGGGCTGNHVITRTWKATDNCGNSSTCIQNITIHDITPPVITCPSNITINCQNSILPSNTGTATATDNCDPAPVITYTDVNTPGSCPGNYVITRTWKATDYCANFSTCQQTITVHDITAPVITCPSNITINCQVLPLPANTGIATATDNCDAAPVITYTDVNIPGSCTGNHVITRTWKATDNCGNFSICIQTITIHDVTPPVITCPVNITVNCQDPVIPANTGTATAMDNCDPAPVITYTDATTQGGCPGNYFITRTWKATDNCGNFSTCIQTITVQDVTPPVITCPASLTINCQDPQLPAFTGTATVTDNCDPAPVLTYTDVTTAGSCPGNYVITRTWKATDNCNNFSTCLQTITVRDISPPVITCPANLTINCDDPTTPATTGTATATDNCDPAPVITHSDVTIPGGCAGTSVITRTWTAIDYCENSISCIQTITIQDVTPPSITCPGPVIVECITDVPAPDISLVTASDNCGPVTVTFVSDVNDGLFCPTIITRTYQAADDCGNSATCQQIIIVQDFTPPVLTCPADIAINCQDPTTPAFTGTATATDNCDPTPVVTYTDVITAGGCSDNKVITRTWSATDACGNSSLCVQTITVQDITPPVITSCPSSVNTLADLGKPYATILLPVPVYSDNCTAVANISVTWTMTAPTAGSGSGIIPVPFQFNIGMTTVIYNITDACGNVSNCSFVVIVASNFPPEIACPDAINKTADPGLCSTDIDPGFPTLVSGTPPITYTWVMSGVTTGSGSDSIIPDPYTFNAGITTITWRATNFAGFDECTQTITVADNQLPTFTAPLPLTFCVENIYTADYYDPTMDIRPDRPDYYLFEAGDVDLDLNPATFADNCPLNCVVEIRWRISFSDGTFLPPLPSLYNTGQPSAYGTDIQLPGDGVNFTDVVHSITYWIVDCNGNISLPVTINITIKPRPNVIKQ